MIKRLKPQTPPAWLHLSWLKPLVVLWALTLLVWTALGADMVLRSAHQDRTAAQLAARLHLTAPAYFPAGHPLRHPESNHPGIQAHHSPRLPHRRPQSQLLPGAFSTWERQP